MAMLGSAGARTTMCIAITIATAITTAASTAAIIGILIAGITAAGNPDPDLMFLRKLAGMSRLALVSLVRQKAPRSGSGVPSEERESIISANRLKRTPGCWCG